MEVKCEVNNGKICAPDEEGFGLCGDYIGFTEEEALKNCHWAREPRFILSMRCEDMDNPVLGSIKRLCMKCGKDCWISPTLADKVDSMDGVICTVCIKDIKEEKKFIVRREVKEEAVKDLKERGYDVDEKKLEELTEKIKKDLNGELIMEKEKDPEETDKELFERFKKQNEILERIQKKLIKAQATIGAADILGLDFDNKSSIVYKYMDDIVRDLKKLKETKE